jgi:MFS family permease
MIVPVKKSTGETDLKFTAWGNAAPERRYEWQVLLILSFVNGIVALDRLAVNFLSPYFFGPLGLTNAQLGLLSSALSASIAVFGFLIANAADRTGRQKAILVWVLIAFSLLSAGAGVATGFVTLFMARFALGASEGPLVPLTQTLMHSASPPARRGFNMGTMQIAGAFAIGAMLGPPIMVHLAETLGWRIAFFVSAVPGLIGAALVATVLRDPRKEAPALSAPPLLPIRLLLRSRNLLLSMAIATLFTAWLTIQNVFMPRYLTDTLGFSKPVMGWMLGLAGLGGLVGGVLIPALSDRFGRRTMVIAAGFCSILTPLALLYVTHSAVLLALLLMVGWLTIGCAPLVCAIIPAETVPLSRTTTAVALSMCTAELFGGVLSPPLAGWAADLWGLRAPFYLDIALALACGGLGLALKKGER